jgi:hypothetical protein
MGLRSSSISSPAGLFLVKIAHSLALSGESLSETLNRSYYGSCGAACASFAHALAVCACFPLKIHDCYPDSADQICSATYRNNKLRG